MTGPVSNGVRFGPPKWEESFLDESDLGTPSWNVPPKEFSKYRNGMIHAGFKDFPQKNREQDSGKVVELNSWHEIKY